MKRLLLFFGIISGLAVQGQLTAPFTESFNSSSTPAGWTNNTTDAWRFSGSMGYDAAVIGDHTGTASSWFAWVDGSGTAYARTELETDSIDVSGLTNAMLEFYLSSYNPTYVAANGSNTFSVDFYDGTTWNDSIYIHAGSFPGWRYVPIDLSSYTISGNVVVRFNVNTTTASTAFYNDIAIDDVSVKELPACFFPLNLRSTGVTATTSTLKWSTVTNAVNGYTIMYGAQGFDPQTGGTSTTSTTDSVVITGLTGATTYDAYIIADCGSVDGISDTTGPMSFTTSCVPFTAPYTTNFDSDADGAVALCWEQYSSYGSGAYARVENQGTPRSGTQQLAIYSSGASATADTLVAISPQFSDLTTGNKQINFWTKSSSSSNALIVGTASGSTPGSSFTPIDTVTFASSSVYQEVIIPFTTANGYNGTDEYIVLAHSIGSTFSYVYLDDFTYEVIPPCPKLAGAAITNVGITTAEITFSGTADSVQYEYGPVGFTQGTGTLTSVGSAPYTISGLSSQTCYDVYVRNNCTAGGNGYSSWDGPLTFCTLCTTVSLPYSEDFDISLGCFSAIDGGTSADTWVHAPAAGNGTYSGNLDGTGHASVDSDAAGFGPTLFEELVSPFIDASNVQGTLYLEFDQYYNHLGSSAEIEVYDGTQWINVLTQNTGDVGSFTSPDHQQIDITAYANDSLQVKFIYDDQGSFAWYWIIDNVLVHDVVCPQPTALGALNQGMNQVDLTWTTGGASHWVVEYGSAGFTLGTGTTINATNDTITVAGLATATAYEFYVRDSCSSGSLSNWAGPYPFSTLICAASQRCNFTVNLYDTWGDGWNGAEITIRQNGIDITTLGASFITGDSLVGLVVSLCDNLPTEVVLTDAGGFPEEVGFKVISAGVTVATHIASITASQGDTLANFTANCPSCPAPSNLTASNVTDTSATVSWSSFASVQQNQYWVGPSGFYQGSQTNGGTKVFTSNNSFTLDTLSSQACYDVYVRSVCAPGDTSGWMGPVSFCMLCPFVQLPYSENFDNSLGCFSAIDGGSSVDTWIHAPIGGNGNYFGDLDGTGHASVDSDDAGTGATLHEELVSPYIDAANIAGALFLEFDQYYNHLGSLAQVEVYDGNVWDTVLIQNTADVGSFAAPDHQKIDITAYANDSLRIKFVYDDQASWAWYWLIDNVLVHDETCPNPTALTASNVTSTSLDFSFTPGVSTVNNFEISYGLSLQNPANGTKVIQSATSLTLNNLQLAANYCFFVRDICAVGDTSIWSGPYCVSTLCPPSFSAPYHTDFEGVSLGNLSSWENCWTSSSSSFMNWEAEDSEGANENSLNTGPFYDATFPTTTKGKYMYLETSSSGTSAELVSPAIDISTVGDPELRFYYHMYGATIDRLEVHAENVNTGARTFLDSIQGQQQLAGSDSFHLRTVNLIGLSPGAYKFVFEGFRGTTLESDIAIDEVSIINNDCPGVANVATANNGCDSIELNWNSATGGSIIEYGIAGFTPGSGTFTGIVTSPYSVTGLSAGNSYTFRIADTCGTDTSSYSSITDTTVSGPIPVAAFSIDSAFVNGQYVVYVNALGSQNADIFQWIYSNKTDFGIVDTNTFTTNGPQTISLVVSNGCGSDTATFTTFVNIGLENVNAPENLRVYPNPTNNVLHISFLRSNAQDVAISLTDAQGRVVVKVADKALSQKYENKLSLGHLATGMYMLEIRTGEKVSKQRIVVKH